MENSSLPTEEKKSERSATVKALGVAFDLGYTIAIPLVVFGLGGRLLDKKFETHPIFFLVGLVLALTASSLWLSKQLSSLVRSLNT